MKKLSLFSLLFIISVALAEDPANPEVVYPIEIVGRSWIDGSNITQNFNSDVSIFWGRPAYLQLLAVLALDPSINTDTRGIDKNKLYRLWSRVVLEAKIKDGNLTVIIVDKDVDGGLEAGGLLAGTFNITDPPLLVRVGNKYNFFYKCWGHPNILGEPAFQNIYPRLSLNIYHTVTGEISIENGALKHSFVLGGSRFPTHNLYVNTVLITELTQSYISDLWRSDPADAFFVIPVP